MHLFSACTPPLCVGGGGVVLFRLRPRRTPQSGETSTGRCSTAEPSRPSQVSSTAMLVFPPGRVGPFERSVTGWRSLAIQLALFPSPFGTAYFSARKSDVIIIVILLASAEPLFLTEFFFVEAL